MKKPKAGDKIDPVKKKIVSTYQQESFWQNSNISIDRVTEVIRDEFDVFEKHSGRLPSIEDKDIGAVWVISGSGSYLAPLIDSPSDRIYAKNKWYPGQDKVRLDYAKRYLEALVKLFPNKRPVLIYNGTKSQNADLLEAIKTGEFKLSKSHLYIAPGEISRTLDQVKKFSFPPSFKKGSKLAILSHSAHLPRVLRFLEKFPEPFKGVEIVPLSINISNKAFQRQMRKAELDNLLGCISRGEAAIELYKTKREIVKVSPVGRGDVLDIYKLSNQDSVRAASFNQAKIKFENHKSWFAKKLKDKNVIMLKAAIDKKLAGQARLEIDGDKAVIGISTSEKFRGKGVASQLLSAAKRKAIQARLASIIAYIKPENLSSINLFEKNGFVCEGETRVSGAKAKRYSYKL